MHVCIRTRTHICIYVCGLEQGSPIPGSATDPRPVRNRAAQEEVSGEGAREASLVAPHRSHYRLNRPPIHGKIVFHETGRLGSAGLENNKIT